MLDDQTMRYLLVSIILTVMVAGLVLAARWGYQANRGPVLPPQRRYPFAPWSGPEVTLAMLLYVGIPGLFVGFAQLAGLVPALQPGESPSGQQLYELIIVRTIAAPVTLVAILGMLWGISRTRPRSLGLRWWRWRPILVVGFTTFIIVTPMVQGINWLAIWVTETLNGEIQSHPLQRLATEVGRPSAWVLVAFNAIVVAPVLEEVLFRGILMPWLGRRWWGGWAAMAGAITMGLLMAGEQRGPIVFALLMCLLGIAFTFPHVGEQRVRRSIIGTGLLFAMFHVSVWPSPIPLFLLGIALGWAAHRTRSLLAPILIHALFNATGTVFILLASGEH